jgi:biotin synthase
MDIRQLLNKEILSKKDIITLLQVQDTDNIEYLFSEACKVRDKYFGNKIFLRGIIEFSNNCEQNCLYCGLRKGNRTLQRYRMHNNLILSIAETISKYGIKTIVLQSGEDTHYSCESIREIILEIKSRLDTAITLSLGERTFEEYQAWKEAGADRYLLKHETANKKLYSIYHQNQFLSDRINHLKFMKLIGYQVGSGNLIGLPYQVIEDIADDILLCKKLQVDMASFSPFIPSTDTPYGSKRSAELLFVLKVMAIARIVLQDVYIPATTALSALNREGIRMGLQAGANVIMPDFTLPTFSAQYKIYPNKFMDHNIASTIRSIKNVINSLSLKIDYSRGDTLKSYNEAIFK